MSLLECKSKCRTKTPQGILALFFIQIVSTLSFSVLYSTLVLYMKGKLGLEVATANTIMGVFIAFNFGLHLLGGFMCGRFLSIRALFCVGMLFQLLGCFLLSVGGINFLYYGLAAFLTGSGLNVTCLNCMLTQRFAPDDTRRETAFLWNYAGMNIGFFIGFSLSGFFQLSGNYQQLFLLSSLGNFIALLICLYCWQELNDKDTIYSKKSNTAKINSTFLGTVFICFLPLMLTQALQHASGANKLVLVTGVFMLLVILYLAYRQPSKESKNKMLAFGILMIVGTVFWMLYQIGPMGLTIFIENNVQRQYYSFIIPPQWFQNVNTFAIVIGGPILGILLSRMRDKGIQVNIPTQFAFALFFIGLAFVILPLGITLADSNGMVNPSYVVVSFILQSIGELLISPIGYAMIGSLAPASLQGVMMGMWMLNTGVGAILSSYSSNLMTLGQESTSPLITNSSYSHVFLILGLFGMGCSFVLCLMVPRLKGLLHKKKLSTHQEPEQVVIMEGNVM